jgi:hypothetical protein
MKYIGQIWQVRLDGIVSESTWEQTRGVKVKAGGAGRLGEGATAWHVTDGRAERRFWYLGRV